MSIAKYVELTLLYNKILNFAGVYTTDANTISSYFCTVSVLSEILDLLNSTYKSACSTYEYELF